MTKTPSQQTKNQNKIFRKLGAMGLGKHRLPPSLPAPWMEEWG